MLEKLLSFLLHAKGGAVATVLVLGASGALVTATVENGVANVTVTQPSQTTTGSDTTTTGSTTTSTNNTVTQQILALFSRTKAEDDPSAPATGNGCSDAAHANNVQVARVNAAYKTDHAKVLDLSKTAPKTAEARADVKFSDGKIKDWRQAGVKAIHELFKSDECKGNDDEDKDSKDTEDEDDTAATTGTTTGTSTGTTSTTTTTTSTVAISCTDAKACADEAIAQMDAEVLSLKGKLDLLAAAPTTTTTSDKGKADSKSTKSDKKKGHSEGRRNDD